MSILHLKSWVKNKTSHRPLSKYQLSLICFWAFTGPLIHLKLEEGHERRMDVWLDCNEPIVCLYRDMEPQDTDWFMLRHSEESCRRELRGNHLAPILYYWHSNEFAVLTVNWIVWDYWILSSFHSTMPLNTWRTWSNIQTLSVLMVVIKHIVGKSSFPSILIGEEDIAGWAI